MWYKMWKPVHDAVPGRSHTSQGISCQDITAVKQQNGITCLLLADGAGSASLSEYGAQTAVEAGGEFIIQHFDALAAAGEKERQELAEELVCFQRDALENRARELGATRIEELASTFLAVAVREERYVTVHIGDGIIAVVYNLREDENVKVDVISQPRNGEFVNVTYFTTSKDYLLGTDLGNGSVKNIDAFVLMSDGSGENFYDPQAGTLVPVVGRLAKKLQLFDLTRGKEQLHAVLKYIATQNTEDDCSLAYLLRMSVNEQKGEAADEKAKGNKNEQNEGVKKQQSKEGGISL